MNKVFNINLGGSPLTIDEDAYRLLENYLQSLHNHFRQSEGYDEIMNDIEARLGELVQEGMGKRTIATSQDVKNAVSVMGTPEDFGAQSIDNQDDTQKKSENTEGAFLGGIKTGKRLFRDEQHCQVGGVCSGMSAYLGISDPIWLRLAFLGLFFLGGTGVGLYIILWIVIPAAKNAGDRLAMKGAPIDVNSIAKTVEEGVEKLSQKVNELSNPEDKERFNSQIKQTSGFIGNAIRNILMGLKGVGKFAVLGAAFFAVLIILIIWVSLVIAAGWAYPVFGYLSDASWFGPLVLFNGFWLMIIPAVSIILFIRRIMYKRPVSGVVNAGLWGFFTLNIISLFALTGITGRDFNQETSVTQQIPLQNPTTNVLNLETMSKPYDELHTSIGDLRISEDYITSENVWGSIVKSDGNQFELIRRINSNGRNSEEAYRLANAIEAKYDIKNDDVSISKFFKISKGTKWRGQSIEYILKMPVGKRIKKIKKGIYPIIDWNPNESVEEEDSDDFNTVYENEDKEEIYEMTTKGLKRVGGTKTKKVEE
jgi:phage shock protein PspC (stress-responsive transcriptional regulator)